MDDKVQNTHPDYDKAQPLRTIFDDVCSGTATMRAKGKAYLPQFPKEHNDDWKYRKDTATLLNITDKTLQTLCGLVFQKDISFNDDVPPEIAGTENTSGLVENIDNKGNHFNVFARDLFEDSFDGCALILVDAPVATATDAGQQKALGLRPYWCKYTAADIRNWNYEIDPISKRLILSLLVLHENVTTIEGMFMRKAKEQYRVLRLVNKVATWELWTEVEGATLNNEKTFVKKEEGTFGNQTELPVAIVGDLCDAPPLLDLAFKNIEHYQTYSDYKSIIHKTCVPMLWTAGLDGETPDNIGGSSWWKLTEQGKMGFAEVSGNSIEKTRQSLEDCKSEMATLGLQMLMANRRPGADVTATEKMLDSIQETSTLQVQATQLKDALELALGYTAQYMNLGMDKGGTINLGATWTELAITSDELKTWADMVDMGLMSLETLVELRAAAGQLPEDVDAEEELKRIKDEQADLAKTKPVLNAVKMPAPATGSDTMETA